MKKPVLFLVGAAVVPLVLCSHAFAQTIDYGSLEGLFGESVTTGATGQPQRASEAPVSMEIITAEEIRRSGAMNIPDILRTHSSLSVWRWMRGTADVTVRGYNQAYSPRLQVFLNGRQLYSDAFSNIYWDSIPVQLNEIRQIEIVKGPNSALFGFNAVSGVINIITYNPMYDDVSGVSVHAGLKDFKKGQAVFSKKLGDKVGVRVSAGASSFDEFDMSPGVTPFFSPRFYQFAGDTVIQVTENSQLRLEGSRAHTKTTQMPPTYAPANQKYITDSYKAGYTANTDIGIVEGNFYHNELALGIYGNPALDVDYKNKVSVAQLSDLFKIGTSHTVRLQSKYRHNTMQGKITSGAEIYYDVYSAGAMWNWDITDSLSWTNAVRGDYLDLGRSGPIVANSIITANHQFDKELLEMSYNSGLVWDVTEEDTLRFMAARGVMLPSLIDYGANLSFGGLVSEGDPALNPSIVTNYEIGYDKKIDAIDGILRSGIFYQTTEDIRSTLAKVAGGVILPANIGSSGTVGLELGIEGNMDEHWSWGTDYKLQFVEDDLSINKGIVTAPYNGEEASPAHTLNLHLGYKNGKWEADGYAQYVSGYESLLSNGTTYDPVKAGNAVGLSARMGYMLTDNVTVALSGQELNHASVRETSGPKKERQVFLSLSTNF